MPGKNIETYIGCDCDYEQADGVLFGAPFDCTCSNRPGSRFAGRAMRTESWGLETYSPYQDRDMSDIRIFDAGELELPFGDTTAALQQIEAAAAQIYQDGKRPIMIGGEHLVTLGAVRAAYARYPDLHIIHFDAHTDLRDEYLGVKLSHATVIRRCWELLGDGRIFQFGIRSGERDEFLFAKAHTCLEKFDFRTLPQAVEKLRDKPVYFTLDLDVIDSGEFPGTGTPEAGGVSFRELLDALCRLHGLRVVGCDINELCPPCDTTGASTALACKVLRELLLSLF